MDSGNETKLDEIQQANKFIQRLHNLEIVFKSRPKKEKELAEISKKISFYILKYQQQESGYYKGFYARHLLAWINRAYTMDFIDTGDGLYKKFTELEKQNKLLRERLDEFSQRCQQLEKEKQDLEKYYRDMDGGSIVGDPFE